MAAVKLSKTDIATNWSGTADYDLIIIGAGIAGLTTGLIWQKTHPKHRILIVEKEMFPGGYVTAYRRGEYVFETTQLVPDIVDILEFIGIDLNLKPYEGNFMRRIVVNDDDVAEYHLPAGADNLKTYLQDLFPHQAGNIGRMMDYSVQLFAQVRKLKAVSTPIDKILTPLMAPKVIVNFNRTYAEFLDRFGIRDPRLRELMETFTSFAGVPPGQASSILTTGAMLSSVRRCFRTRGYFDSIPAKLAALFQEQGGEIRLNSPVERIEIRNGRAASLSVSGDETSIRARRFVSTVDPNVLVHRLIGDEAFPPAYVKKLNDTVMSASSINVSLGLDDRIDLAALDLDYPYNVLSTGLGTSDRLFDAFLEGRNAFTEKLFHMGVVCPSLTTGGKPTVTIRVVPVAPTEWISRRRDDRSAYREEKDRWGDFFIGLVEKYLVPGLADHIVVKDVATPATYARYSGSPTGSLYDMASLVSQFGPRRLGLQTPIPNLVQPKFSHGLYGSMMGAVQVVDLMMNRSFNGGKSLFDPKG